MCEINSLMKLANKVATEKGFWEDFDILTKKMNNSDIFDEIEIERLKMAFFNEKISLISSELGEATESMRIGKYCRLNDDELNLIVGLKEEDMGDTKYVGSYITHIKDTFQDEIADAFIRLMDLCYKMNIDIEKFILMKMEYNKYRDPKHGKRF